MNLGFYFGVCIDQLRFGAAGILCASEGGICGRPSHDFGNLGMTRRDANKFFCFNVRTFLSFTSLLCP